MVRVALCNFWVVFVCRNILDRIFITGEGKGMKSKQVFVLEVNKTENQSWQGKIKWIQGKKKESYRSVIELLRLMDSVVYEKEDMAGEVSLDQR